MKETLKEKLMKNMGYLIVLIDIGIYFILSYVYVEKLQVNILAIIVNSSLLFVGAVIATTAMMRQGILIGRDTEKYKETLTAHLTQKKKIFPKLNLLQGWLDRNYLELLKIGRSVFINSAGFDYNELFNADGKLINDFKLKKPEAKTYKKWYQRTILLPFLKLGRWLFSDEWHLYREQKKFIRKAKRYKITRLTVSDIINVNADADPNNFGITENQYQKRTAGKAAASRLIFSILLQSVAFGFYGFNIETFLVQLLSITMIVLTSLFEMFNAYSFMVKTHRDTIIKKINKMEEFDNADAKVLAEIKAEKEKEKEEQENDTEISLCAKSDLVQTLHGPDDTGQAQDLCSN